jgi:hypothetical protein
MKKFIRLFVGTAALAAAISWTVTVMNVNDWRAPMAGMGDNAVSARESGGEQLFDVLFIGAICLLPISPYLCMAAGAFNLINGKPLRVAYIYSLVVLSLMTLIMFVSFKRRLEFIAVGNVIVGGLWAYGFRGVASVPVEPEQPQ